MLTILNDLHIGAVRSAGTTPASQWALRKYLLSEFGRLLPADGDLLLLGDLFDTSNVPIHDVLHTFKLLAAWLDEDPTAKLYNTMGNHDASKTSNILSSFQFLGSLLSHTHPDQYVHIDKPQMTPYGYVIPHCINQDLFDLALQKAEPSKYLFLHCNVDNGFAAQSDQSLNISLEQVGGLPHEVLIVAHEHHSRVLPKVVLPGNQIASSVSDWLSPHDKQFLTIVDGVLSRQTCAVRSENFVEMNWREAGETTAKFIRVVGEATAEEATAAINAVNKIRKSNDAFVVTNAIVVSSDETNTDVFAQSLEGVQQFDIMASLREFLNAEEMAIVESVNA